METVKSDNKAAGHQAANLELEGGARILKEFFEYLSGRAAKSNTLTPAGRSMQNHYAAFEEEASRLRNEDLGK